MEKVEVLKASPDNWEEVWNIVKKVAEWMQEQGMDHWSSYYTPEVIKEKIETADVFILFVDGKAAGTGSFIDHEPDYYSKEDLDCFTKSDKVAYLTTLAVLPEYQGKGYGKTLVREREEYAKKSGRYEFLRFDARASYKELIKFHLKNRFKIVGVMDDEGEYYFLFEKDIRA